MLFGLTHVQFSQGRGLFFLWRALLWPWKAKKKVKTHERLWQKLLSFSAENLNSAESSFLSSSDHVWSMFGRFWILTSLCLPRKIEVVVPQELLPTPPLWTPWSMHEWLGFSLFQVGFQSQTSWHGGRGEQSYQWRVISKGDVFSRVSFEQSLFWTALIFLSRAQFTGQIFDIL